MNCTCPRCGTTYRVDPAKVPEGGVNARCMRCEGVIRVAVAAQTAPSASEPAMQNGPGTLTVPAAPTGGSAAAKATSPFGASDPHARARRLARALISDIVAYHPERRSRSLASGTLREEFREEIRMSWDEYQSQVGDLARRTPFFRDALNEILAGGARVF